MNITENEKKKTFKNCTVVSIKTINVQEVMISLPTKAKLKKKRCYLIHFKNTRVKYLTVR